MEQLALFALPRLAKDEEETAASPEVAPVLHSDPEDHRTLEEGPRDRSTVTIT